MAVPCVSLLLRLFLGFFILPVSLSNIQKFKMMGPQLSYEESQPLSHAHGRLRNEIPTTFFEVQKPIKLPHTRPCSSLILQHDFRHTYGQPAVAVPYKPPTDCPSHTFSKIVLEWRATCRGRQFDRIFGVWLGGVELLRSCTAEPTARGIVWTVEKDITRYSSLLKKSSQTLSVYLANVVDKTYTGVYHVNLTFHFYPAEQKIPDSGKLSADLDSITSSHADLIIPISRSLPLNDGLWFVIENSTETELKEFIVPRNAYRAVLEVFVSYHSSDEFWYGNPPNEYIVKNNLTRVSGNGPFREVVVTLDDKVVGAVWPFTVIYTGGVNPLLWRPITGIGSFDLPSYDIEITPFLGKILDGKSHTFGFAVTNALQVWFVDANLHIWLDHCSSQTTGHLLKAKARSLRIYSRSKFKGLDGTFFTTARRHISSAGWVNSSHGKILTHAFQGFDFFNRMRLEKSADRQIVNQGIRVNSLISVNVASSAMYSVQVFNNFPLYLYTDILSQDNGSYHLVSNVSLGFHEGRFYDGNIGFSFSTLMNRQNGEGSIIVKDDLASRGIGSTEQAYRYNSYNDCYFRNVSSRNYSILWNLSSENCQEIIKMGGGIGFNRWPLSPSKQFSLLSDLQVK